MGLYTTDPITEKQLKDLIEIITTGYTDDKGTPHKPNKQVATILTLQANLGCRIGDICNLTVENFIKDGEIWKLDLTEQKTGKKRYFIVPQKVKKFIDKWTKDNHITTGRLFSIGEYAVWKQLRPATKVLELENISAHSIRKLAGQRLYKSSGNDISLVCQYYQHSSPAITQQYLRRTSKQMDEAITKSVLMV